MPRECCAGMLIICSGPLEYRVAEFRAGVQVPVRDTGTHRVGTSEYRPTGVILARVLNPHSLFWSLETPQQFVIGILRVFRWRTGPSKPFDSGHSGNWLP